MKKKERRKREMAMEGVSECVRGGLRRPRS
jgi:hypothetical protein